MNHRAAALALLLGVPPGLGMGLALMSRTRGDELIWSAVVGVAAAIALSALIYLLAVHGSVEEPNSPAD